MERNVQPREHVDSARVDFAQFQRCFHPYQWWVLEACTQLDEELLTERHIMYIARPTEDGKWMVGCWFPDKSWFTDSTFSGPNAQLLAHHHVRWLHGGSMADAPVTASAIAEGSCQLRAV